MFDPHIEEIIERVGEKGLSQEQVKNNRELYGENTGLFSCFSEEEKKEERIKDLRRIYLSPRQVLILIAGVLFLTNKQISAGLIIISIYVLISTLVYINRDAQNKKIKGLYNLTPVRYKLLRSGTLIKKRREEIVPEDIIVLTEDELVPADASIILCEGMAVDESILGLSVRCEKVSSYSSKNPNFSNNKTAATDNAVFRAKTGTSIFEDINTATHKNQADAFSEDLDVNGKNILYAGTRIISGYAIASVYHTGKETRIANSREIKGAMDFYSPRTGSLIAGLTKKVVSKVNLAAVGIAVISGIVSIISALTSGSYEVLPEKLLLSSLLGLIVSCADFSTLYEYSLLRAGYKLAGKKIFTKSMANLEKALAANTLCLEESSFSIPEEYSVADFYHPQKNLTSLLTVATASMPPSSANLSRVEDIKLKPVAEVFTHTANIENPFSEKTLNIKDIPSEKIRPEDRACLEFAIRKEFNVNAIFDGELLKTFPYSEREKIGGNIYKIHGKRIFAVRGSPGAVLTLCAHQPRRMFLYKQAQAECEKEFGELVAFAYAPLDEYDKAPELGYFSDVEMPDSFSDVKFKFAGFLCIDSALNPSAVWAAMTLQDFGVKINLFSEKNHESAEYAAVRYGFTQRGTSSYTSGKTVSARALVMRGDEISAAMKTSAEFDFSGIDVFSEMGNDLTSQSLTNGFYTDGTIGRRSFVTKKLKEQGQFILSATNEKYFSFEKSELFYAADLRLVSLNRFDKGFPQFNNALIESADIIFAEDIFASLTKSLETIRRYHTFFKKVVRVTAVTWVTLIPFGVVNLFFYRGQFFISPFSAVFTILLIPAVSFVSFLPFAGRGSFGAGADKYSEPSEFARKIIRSSETGEVSALKIKKNVIPIIKKDGETFPLLKGLFGENGLFGLKTVIQSACVFAALLTILLFFYDLTAAETRTAFFVCTIFAISGVLITRISDNKPYIKLLSKALKKSRKKRAAASIISLFGVVMLIIFCLLLVVTKTGRNLSDFGELKSGSFAVAALIGFVSTIWTDFLHIQRDR